MNFSISKSLQDAIVNVTKELTMEEAQQLDEYYTVHPHVNGHPKPIGTPTKFYSSAMSTAIKHSKEGHEVTVRVNDHKGVVDSVHIKPGDHVKSKMESLKDKRVEEDVQQVDEVSKKTLDNYVKKASSDYGHSEFASRAARDPEEKSSWAKRALKRAKGLERAVPRVVGEEQMEEAALHPMALHVKPVKVNGKTKYHVHAVGKELGGGIKVGEHLTDTHLDDAAEMGAKIKHLKEDQMVDKTIELHDDFIVDLPNELGFQDYLNAAQKFSEDPADAVMIADSFFKNKDESLVIENFMRSDIESKIKSHEKAGSKVDDTKYSTKNGKPYAEYTVTDSEGRKTRYIHHGSTRRVERE